MQTVAIIGVGLIGGSFGLALRQAGFEGELLGVSSSRAIEAGLLAGAIHRSVTLEQAAAAADLIYLAQPVDRILETLAALGPLARPDCLITDAGSTKAMIVRKAAECIPLTPFLGGHPMAGKEQRGAAAAESGLFRDRPYVLTSDSAQTARHDDFRSWLRRIGANVIEMSATEHDRIVAFTSHLPQMLATSLSGTLASRHDPGLLQVFGPGLLDMTRLALSTPDLWASILATNKAEITLCVNLFQEYLRQLTDAIGTGGLPPLFSMATQFASSIRKLPSIDER